MGGVPLMSSEGQPASGLAAEKWGETATDRTCLMPVTITTADSGLIMVNGDDNRNV